MRFKKRFVFIANKGEKLSLSEARRFFGIPLKHFDEGKQEAVVKCKPKGLEAVKKAFSGKAVFEGKKLLLGVRKVSASFALRTYQRNH